MRGLLHRRAFPCQTLRPLGGIFREIDERQRLRINNSGSALTKVQEKILAILKETNGIEFEPLAGRLGITPDALHREIATLRHMEKLTAALDGDKKVFRLWQ